MSIRNFSKLIQKTICRQTIQMPKYVPFRNFGSLNPGSRIPEGKLRDSGELKKAEEARFGEQLEMPQTQFNLKDAKQQQDNLVFDNEGAKSGIENPASTDKDRVFNQDKSFDQERDFSKEKVFDINLRGANENQQWQGRSQENSKWAERSQQEEKTDSFNDDMKNQQILGTGFESESMRKLSKGIDASKEDIVSQNTGADYNPRYLEDSKVVFKFDDIDPTKSDLSGKKDQNIIANQYNSGMPKESYQNERPQKTSDMPDNTSQIPNQSYQSERPDQQFQSEKPNQKSEKSEKSDKSDKQFKSERTDQSSQESQQDKQQPFKNLKF